MNTKYSIGDVLVIYDNSRECRIASDIVEIKVNRNGTFYTLSYFRDNAEHPVVIRERANESCVYQIIGKIGTLFSTVGKEDEGYVKARYLST